MLITKANLSVALAAPKPTGDGDGDRGYALEHIQIDPEHETVTATNGAGVHVSRIEVPEYPECPGRPPEPVYLPAAKAKKLAATIGNKSLGLPTSHNRTHDWDSLGSVILTPDKDIAWPDIRRILPDADADMEKAPETLITSAIPLDELARMVEAFDNHGIHHITFRVCGGEKPLIVESQKDKGHTLTAYIKPLREY